MKVIFVGDKPSLRMKPGAKPFEGAACEKRLMEWIYTVIGSNEFTVVNSTDFVFLALCCIKLGFLASMDRNDKDFCFIALGNNASKALKAFPHFKLPHPSGLNRQINNKEFIEQQLQLAKEYINNVSHNGQNQ